MTDEEGKIILASPSQIAVSPNGNGGVYSALGNSGCLDDMKRRGVENVHLFGVDNILVKAADPTFVGFAVSQGAECANKCVLKREPHEKVGVQALRGGKNFVVEYSEISKEQAEQRDATGGLVYAAGNIAQHYFTVDFISKAVQADLPLHIANKAVSHVTLQDGKMSPVVPSSPNAVKLEMFVFDTFSFSNKLSVLAVPRESNFTAVKNAPKPGAQDSPLTARQALSEYHISLVEKAGGKVVRDVSLPMYDEKNLFEISPLVTYEGEGLAALVNGKTFTTPYYLARL